MDPGKDGSLRDGRPHGPAPGIQVIKEAFMMGADEGYVLSDRKIAGSDVLATSYTLSQGIKAIGAFDLIICGKQTTDGDTAQVGPRHRRNASHPPCRMGKGDQGNHRRKDRGGAGLGGQLRDRRASLPLSHHRGKKAFSSRGFPPISESSKRRTKKSKSSLLPIFRTRTS